MSKPCRVRREGNRLELVSPHFTYRLDTRGPLRAVSWENLLTGTTLALRGGQEFGAELDAAERRIWIPGWRAKPLDDPHAAPNREQGYRDGLFREAVVDRDWELVLQPIEMPHGWFRTRVYIPADCEGRRMRLVLGGFGPYRFRSMRLFVNGVRVAAYRNGKRWDAPWEIDLSPKTRAGRALRPGGANVLALQATDRRERTERIEKLDPKGMLELTSHRHPFQFEQFIVVGEPIRRAAFRVEKTKVLREGRRGELEVVLYDRKTKLRARLHYRWDADTPVLHRFGEIENASDATVRLMHVDHGDYASDGRMEEGGQGEPLLAAGDRYLSLAHPAGFAMGREDGSFLLRQHPAEEIAPGASFRTMETVLGVSERGVAREAFRRHLEARMRRVRRGHDDPRALFEIFGSWPGEPGLRWFFLKEKDALHVLKNVEKGAKESDCRFDACFVDFWHDRGADPREPDAELFPDGFDRTRKAIRRGGMEMGLWISSCRTDWNSGYSPLMMSEAWAGAGACIDPDLAWMCMASETYRNVFLDALRHHIHTNGVRYLKLDNYFPRCQNTAHGHFPGVYGTEAYMNGTQTFLRALDAECPELFLILYWGYRSPWWLLDGDVSFDPGFFREASSPALEPSLRARDGVNCTLDQAVRFRSAPPLGQDTLGVWLSDWQWNSGIGHAGWRDGMVLDLCRGTLLLQPWSDYSWRNATERRWMGEIIRLLREHTTCFRDPRPVLGDPWKHEPYGMLCADGERAFLAVLNFGWTDYDLRLPLGPDGGLPEAEGYDLYRWHPAPARLKAEKGVFAKTATIPMRPFQTMLLEIVPAGTAPSLGKRFRSKTVPSGFAEPSVEVGLRVARGGGRSLAPAAAVDPLPEETPPPAVRRHAAKGTVPKTETGGTLAITARMMCGKKVAKHWDVGRRFAARCRIGGVEVAAEPIVAERTLEAAWEGWRISLTPQMGGKSFILEVAEACAPDVTLEWAAHFVPDDPA